MIMLSASKRIPSVAPHRRPIPLHRRILRNWETYVLLLPGLVWYFIFCYMPMGGLTLAFKSYKANLGILGSPWVGLSNYEYVFNDPAFFQALINTLIISAVRILVEFPVPIILALLLGEIRRKGYQKALQTIYTFPNFLSWVVVAGVMINVFESSGLVNGLIVSLGGEEVNFLSSSTSMFVLLFVTNIWKSAGWSSIIYLAAIAGIDSEQYEAATIDGASRFQQMIYITLPSLLPTISVMLILQIGNMMNAGFDQIFNLSNPAVEESLDVLDTYIYRITFQASADFSFSTAISLMKSLVNFLLVILANFSSKRLTDNGLFE